MLTSDVRRENGIIGTKGGSSGAGSNNSDAEYRVTFIESSNVLVSLWRQIWQGLREPKVTVPRQYYRGEVRLPVTDETSWLRDLPGQIKGLLEKPKPVVTTSKPVNVTTENWASELKPWYHDLPGTLKALFEKPKPIVTTAQPIDVPDIWQDYQQQPASWVNSLLVHLVIVAALILPYFISKMIGTPVKASTKEEPIDISPYLAQLPPSAKKAGGGGGGGDRSPTPASRGVLPKFAKVQLAPPQVLPNLTAKLQVQANLLGPPELKLPQMVPGQYGDPQGVLGPLSNGPGSGGGIGTGEGGGIGSGKGGGMGPGEGGGTGGGYYSVGGSVGAPVCIYCPEPPYSEEARKAKYTGTVVLRITVDAQGNVINVQVVKPAGLGLDEKAVEAVRTWKMRPSMRNGVAVAVNNVLVEVSFRLF